jgi:hypothetical protein
MKVLVLVDKAGKVIGTFRPSRLNEGIGQGGLIPLPGQTMHEADVPPETFAIEGGEEFHRAMELHLKKKKK